MFMHILSLNININSSKDKDLKTEIQYTKYNLLTTLNSIRLSSPNDADFSNNFDVPSTRSLIKKSDKLQLKIIKKLLSELKLVFI